MKAMAIMIIANTMRFIFTIGGANQCFILVCVFDESDLFSLEIVLYFSNNN